MRTKGLRQSPRLILCLPLLALLPTFAPGQKAAPPAVFTSEQAASGREAYEKTCARCHTLAMTGRKGDASELPPLLTLSAEDQDFIDKFGPVPALAGREFIGRWKDKTAAEVITRIQEAVAAFPPEGTNDQTAVEITAYALRKSGAQPGDRRLSRTTAAVVRSVVSPDQLPPD